MDTVCIRGPTFKDKLSPTYINDGLETNIIRALSIIQYLVRNPCLSIRQCMYMYWESYIVRYTHMSHYTQLQNTIYIITVKHCTR